MTEPTPIVDAPSPVHRLSTATLIIGVPGSGKTTLLKGFAEYLWEVYKKVLLLYSWDGGAIPTDVQKRMKQGLIRFWRARTRSAPGLGLETLYLASKGYWPRFINPETGESSPAVELVGPLTAKYAVSCPKGHPLMNVPTLALVVPAHCSVCNVIVMQNQLKIAETVTRTKGFEMVGGVAFDGLTSMTDVVLDHMDVQRGEGLIGGEKAAFGGVVTSGSQKFGGNNRADVGFGQTRAHQFVNNSLSIPHLVEGPVFTALAFEATDEGGLPIVGAKLPGRAATDEASSWFGNVAETGKASDDLGKECFALYLRPFTDPQNRRHLLKTSASPTGVPDKLVDPAIEFNRPYSVVNLGSVFRMLDDDLRRSLLEEMPGAPGTPDGMVEYGEALSAPAPAVAAAPMMGGIPVMGMPVPAPASAYPMLMAPAAVAAAVATPTPTPAPAPAETPASTPAAASLSAAAIAPPPAVLDGAARGSSGVPSGPPMMVAQPRKRRGAGQMATTSPIGPPAGLAAVVPPTPQAVSPAPQPVAPAQAPPLATVAAPPSGAPPPPPGMRPPMKAPGS